MCEHGLKFANDSPIWSVIVATKLARWVSSELAILCWTRSSDKLCGFGGVLWRFGSRLAIVFVHSVIYSWLVVEFWVWYLILNYQSAQSEPLLLWVLYGRRLLLKTVIGVRSIVQTTRFPIGINYCPTMGCSMDHRPLTYLFWMVNTSSKLPRIRIDI